MRNNKVFCDGCGSEICDILNHPGYYLSITMIPEHVYSMGDEICQVRDLCKECVKHVLTPLTKKN